MAETSDARFLIDLQRGAVFISPESGRVIVCEGHLAPSGRVRDHVHDTARKEAHVGKYELYKDAGSQYRFRLKAGNGEVIATSEAYTTKAAAQKGIASVQANASSDTVDLT